MAASRPTIRSSVRRPGVNRAIWALGLRNPFTTAFQRSTGRLFINDVGETSWEEINEGAPGANYGWPLAEGPSSRSRFHRPVSLLRPQRRAVRITGGAFYESARARLPDGISRRLLLRRLLRGMDPQDRPGHRHGRRIRGRHRCPVDLKVGPDGALYYLARGDGLVGRISYAAAEPPSITLQPADRTVPVGQPATFTVGATGSAPLAYQWRRNGNVITGRRVELHGRQPAALGQRRAVQRRRVERFGSATSDTAQLTVTQNTAPAAAITQPVGGTTYAGGIRDQLRRHRQRCRGRRLACQRLHLVGRPAPRQHTRIRAWPR